VKEKQIKYALFLQHKTSVIGQPAR